MMNIKKVKPNFNYIVTTMDVYTEDEVKVGGVIDSSKLNLPIKEHQEIIAVGPSVKNMVVGDIVKINPARYEVRHYEERNNQNSIKNDLASMHPVKSYQFKTILLDHKKYLLLTDSDIEYIVEDFEEEKPQSDIIMPNNDIITA